MPLRKRRIKANREMRKMVILIGSLAAGIIILSAIVDINKLIDGLYELIVQFINALK